jgi:hypothetical protein
LHGHVSNEIDSLFVANNDHPTLGKTAFLSYFLAVQRYISRRIPMLATRTRKAPIIALTPFRPFRLLRLEPAKPVARAPTVRGDNQNFNVRTHLAIENIEREAGYAVTADSGWKFDAISIRGFADFRHCCIKGSQITCAESCLASLVIRYVLKVFNTRGIIEKEAHRSKALA